MYRLPRRMIDETFAILRSCGAGERECMVCWASSWDEPAELTTVIHVQHLATSVIVEVDDTWINRLWLDLADHGLGVRVQIHTHGEEAGHSEIDDAFPLIHEAGFLSLVLPDFALGPVGFERAYLTEIQSDGSWSQVPVGSRFTVYE
jgi:hypothetical protein